MNEIISKKFVAHCFVDDNGKKYKTAFFDGYPFGDRLLEGFLFNAKLLPDGRLKVSVPKNDYYFNQLNKEMWLKKALQYALKNDIFQGKDGIDLVFKNE